MCCVWNVLYVVAYTLVASWFYVFFFKQKTAYEMRISDWSSDVCSSDLLGWEKARTLDRLAPARLNTPAGSSHEIDYQADGGPIVHVRVQALFGLAEHPTVAANRVPLKIGRAHV